MAVVPDAMPVLSRGKHRNPSRGACFMEYTALLAGEPFSDRPRCVDPELADVMRQANDRLSAADRPRLVPLLGRSIGLAVGLPAPGPGSGADPHGHDQDVRRYVRRTAALRRAVSRRLLDAVGYVPSPAELRMHDGGKDVGRLFWYLMREPTVPHTSADFVSRLIDRLDLLHRCYEQALGELDLPRSADARREPAEVYSELAAPAPERRRRSLLTGW